MRSVGPIDNIKKSFKYVKLYICPLHNPELNPTLMLDFSSFISEMIAYREEYISIAPNEGHLSVYNRKTNSAKTQNLWTENVITLNIDLFVSSTLKYSLLFWGEKATVPTWLQIFGQSTVIGHL